MYPLVLSVIFVVMTAMMMPGRVLPFSELAFSNPDAAADMGKAEVFAHNMSVYAESLMDVWRQDPSLITYYPMEMTPEDLRRIAPDALPVDYRPVLPWRAFLLKKANTPDALVVMVAEADLPSRLSNAELAQGLRLTAGRQTPVGIVRHGELGMEDLTIPVVREKYNSVIDLPQDVLHDGAVAVVVCFQKGYCRAP